MENCKIVIADDHAMVRNAVKLMIRANEHLEIIGEAGDGIELQGLIKKQVPDVIVVDLKMPRMQGLEAIEKIHAAYPEIKIIVWSGFLNEQSIKRALDSGAYGIVSKAAPQSSLIAAIETVWQGGFYISPEVIEGSNIKRYFVAVTQDDSLTHEEKFIITMIADGHANKEIANILHISKQSVDKRRALIMKKLNLHNVVDLIRYAIKNGYVNL
jgi:DNA-binding NarL/FixJ family response regulator